jgi:hypothetical protein
MSALALDLTRYAWRQEHGDIIAYGTWWLAEDSGPKPCIALLPLRRQSWRTARPAVVLIEQAWVWDEQIGDGARCAQLAFMFAEGLGLAPSAHTLLRIRGIIADHIEDLVRIPPMPPDFRQAEHVGDLRIVERETGRAREVEVVERA